jgi:FKBP-type peptidyl-prolyl cis-trans isomerase 2
MVKKPCKLDTDFQRSISFQRNIEVWIDGELDTVGKIEKFTDDSVKIDGNHYLRENCKFVMV